MTTRPGADQDAVSWTNRQREVLDLLARGLTNGQIAEALGISLDGAKWHVSEIIARLGVDTREEAAEYWRKQNGLVWRLRSSVRTRVSHSAPAWLGAGGVAATLAVAAPRCSSREATVRPHVAHGNACQTGRFPHGHPWLAYGREAKSCS